MGRDPLIALVGKPSSGKSTMLNSLTDASAKTGAFPFTTIDPNKAIGYLQVECACKRYGMEESCRPVYGSCENGVRSVPVQLLDVAGLVPGAHQGKGLGNKFLDDLRHADCLIHVVDVSGTTDAQGKQSRGYDPLQDIEWLTTEIVEWICGNLLVKWSSIVRRHKAVNTGSTGDQSPFQSSVRTLQLQLSGYGATERVVAKVVEQSQLGNKPLQDWTKEDIRHIGEIFVAVKFPTILALNKIDHPDADLNISKISRKYQSSRIVLTSAISEVFIKKLQSQHYVKYTPGTEFLDTYQEDESLRVADEKLMGRIENLRDLVLYRFGSTGVVQVLQQAAKMLNLVPVYPVKSTSNLTSSNRSNLFRDCVLVQSTTTTLGQLAHRIMGDAPIAYIEGPGGIRIKDSDFIVPGKTDIVSFKIGHI